jgi:hypothetical protein
MFAFSGACPSFFISACPFFCAPCFASGVNYALVGLVPGSGSVSSCGPGGIGLSSRGRGYFAARSASDCESGCRVLVPERVAEPISTYFISTDMRIRRSSPSSTQMDLFPEIQQLVQGALDECIFSFQVSFSFLVVLPFCFISHVPSPSNLPTSSDILLPSLSFAPLIFSRLPAVPYVSNFKFTSRGKVISLNSFA